MFSRNNTSRQTSMVIDVKLTSQQITYIMFLSKRAYIIINSTNTSKIGLFKMPMAKTYIFLPTKNKSFWINIFSFRWGFAANTSINKLMIKTASIQPRWTLPAITYLFHRLGPNGKFKKIYLIYFQEMELYTNNRMPNGALSGRIILFLHFFFVKKLFCEMFARRACSNNNFQLLSGHFPFRLRTAWVMRFKHNFLQKVAFRIQHDKTQRTVLSKQIPNNPYC